MWMEEGMSNDVDVDSKRWMCDNGCVKDGYNNDGCGQLQVNVMMCVDGKMWM